MICILLLVCGRAAVLSQTITGTVSKPESVDYRDGRLTSWDGHTLSGEELALIFENPADVKYYRQVQKWFWCGLGMAGVSTIATFGTAGYLATHKDEGEHAFFSTQNRRTFLLVVAGVFVGGCCIKSAYEMKLKRMASDYNEIGIIPARTELSLGVTPNGVGLCFRF